VSSTARSATYEVGQGKRYRSLDAVPWLTLGPGDTVRIHWRNEPYREKVQLACRGTAQRPIRIVGVAGPKGQLPVIDGLDATTCRQSDYRYAPTQERGVIIVTPDSRKRWGYKPGFIEIQGLEVRGAYRGEDTSPNSFKDSRRATRAYAFNAAAIFVERGEHITVRGCTITGSGNGLFVASGDSEEVQSRDILVEGCSIHGNGNPGRDREHNVYTEAIGITFQFNRLGRLRPKALGGNLKDRSAGTVVRCNWIEGGARLLDLVEPQDSHKLATRAPGFSTTFVYGNVLLCGQQDATNLVHYGGDNGNTTIYRKGMLYFYHNTVVIEADRRRHWRTIVLQLETNDEKADVRNNILFRRAATPGETPTELSLMNQFGVATFGVNWVSPGWLTSYSGRPLKGKLSGTGRFLGDRNNDPGFVSLAQSDLRLLRTSPCINKGETLPGAVTKQHSPNRQYKPHQAGEARKVTGAIDLGAFEFSGRAGKTTKPALSLVYRAPSSPRAARSPQNQSFR
jgi:hypothetical protein